MTEYFVSHPSQLCIYLYIITKDEDSESEEEVEIEEEVDTEEEVEVEVEEPEEDEETGEEGTSHQIKQATRKSMYAICQEAGLGKTQVCCICTSVSMQNCFCET